MLILFELTRCLLHKLIFVCPSCECTERVPVTHGRGEQSAWCRTGCRPSVACFTPWQLLQSNATDIEFKVDAHQKTAKLTQAFAPQRFCRSSGARCVRSGSTREGFLLNTSGPDSPQRADPKWPGALSAALCQKPPSSGSDRPWPGCRKATSFRGSRVTLTKRRTGNLITPVSMSQFGQRCRQHRSLHPQRGPTQSSRCA
jgi:hypothetical protein